MEICLSETVTPYFSSIFLDRSFMQKKTITHYFFMCVKLELLTLIVQKTREEAETKGKLDVWCVFLKLLS